MPEFIFDTYFLHFELSHFSSSNSIDGYLVDATPPPVTCCGWIFLKLCSFFCHGLIICMCFLYFPEAIFYSFLWVLN